MKPQRSSSRRRKTTRPQLKKLKPVADIKRDGGIPSVPARIVGLTKESPTWAHQNDVAGIRLPLDFWSVVDASAEGLLQETRTKLTTPPWTFCPEEWTQAEREEWRPMAHECDWDNLRYFLGDAFRQGFVLALLHYREHLSHVGEAVQFLNDQRENGEFLSTEGRIVKAENDRQRAQLICELWGKVRNGYPAGRLGNGQALRTVAERYLAQTHRSITTRAVRNILERCGIKISK